MFFVLVCIVASVAYSEGGTHDPQGLEVITRNFRLQNLGSGRQILGPGIPHNLRFRSPQNLGFQTPQTLGLGIPNQYAINSVLLRHQLLPRGLTYAVQDAPENDVRYSLSYQDYEFLKRHKVYGQDSPYNPEQTVNSSPTIVHLSDKHDNKEFDQNYATHSQDFGKHTHELDKRSDENVKQEKRDVPCSDILTKRSAAGNLINEYNNAHISVPVEPAVYKHVYFHVPPPEFEEEPETNRVIHAPKKNVNILFIKAPSYESNFAYKQQPIEDKTLIYVLSKKEDPPQPDVLLPKPSTVPEVFFVNYKFNPKDSISINNELSLPSLLENIPLNTDREKRDITNS